ncbi:MAG: Eco57I restriction-modification methylase domain-containing protein, partial [Armatimonadetes bacterium]|nr:Eco57I restriction-modification methylase domain-containing protein [Armatimonadota bacterium]
MAIVAFTPADAREAVRLLAQGYLIPDQPLPTLTELKSSATRAFFRLLTLFAEHETGGEPSPWRILLARYGNESAALSEAEAASILADTPLASLLNTTSEGKPPSPSSILAAADRISRLPGPLGSREWTDFRPMTPRDLGHLYEEMMGWDLAPLPGASAGGPPLLTWKENGKGRKVSGTFYTPEPITRHIITSTLDALLQDWPCPNPPSLFGATAFLSSQAVSPPLLPRVLDPAMGCGYFLLEAAQHLYDWMGQNEEWKNASEEDQGKLRAYIARNCLYGVDKDPLVVELARLAVSAWVAERIVSADTLSLESHLRCGNALIGSAPKQSRSHCAPDKKRKRKSKAEEGPMGPEADTFHWAEEFPQIFPPSESAGFDAVVGNPPYDNSRGGLETNPDLAAAAQYARASGEYRVNGAVDLYRLFLQRSLRLCRPGGVLSMIVPRSLLGDRDAAVEREWLTRETELLSIDDFPNDDSTRRVFPSASLAVCIVTCKRGGPTAAFPLRRRPNGQMTGPYRSEAVHTAELERFWPGYLPFVGLSEPEGRVLRKLTSAPWLCPLSEIADAGIGEANSGYHKAFMVNRDTGTLLIRGADVSPYYVRTNGTTEKRWLDREGFLDSLSEEACSRLKADGPRVVKQAVRNIALSKRLIAGLSEPGQFLADSTDFFVARAPYDPHYLLALLNSRTVSEWLFRLVSTNNNVNLYQVRHLPVPRIDFEEK